MSTSPSSERPFVVASHAEFHTRAYEVINAFGSLAHPADVQATDLLMQERRLIEAAAGKEGHSWGVSVTLHSTPCLQLPSASGV